MDASRHYGNMPGSMFVRDGFVRIGIKRICDETSGAILNGPGINLNISLNMRWAKFCSFVFFSFFLYTSFFNNFSFLSSAH